ncbi:hypothetical protein Slin14017_G129170 [Septoria linicola]|nr:hypothetical protein Slin14017_G129170 [Septoria linicola]
MDHASPEKYLGSAAERAPEVAPSNKPLLAHEDSDGLQIIGDDSQKEVIEKMEHVPSSGAVAHLERPSWRRKKMIWLAIAVGIVAAISVVVGLGVHFGIRHRNTSEDAQSTSLSPSSQTKLATADSTPPQSTPTIKTVCTSTFIPSRTMAAEATPSVYIDGELGFFQQGNSQTPLCARPDCPDGYRKVFWDFGCPDGKWKCCI